MAATEKFVPMHPDGCAGCQQLRSARAVWLDWPGSTFPMRLCIACLIGLLLARPARRLRQLWA